MTYPVPDQEECLTIVSATVDVAGRLIEANAGFLRIVPTAEPPNGQRVDSFFIQPNFAALLAGSINADGETYRGLMTVGDRTGLTRTLRGRVWRANGTLRLVAEYDIEELERLNETVLDLNREYAKAQCDLAQVNHRMRSLNVELERRVAERTQALTEALARAESASRAKSVFLANMSHELRTPLNGVLGMTQLLLRGGVTPVQADWLSKIDVSGQHLLGIINDILDLTKFEAGKVALEDKEFGLAELLQQVNAVVGDSINAKGLVLHVDMTGVPLTLRGDANRLGQALINYLSNAVKFTQRGSITLTGRVMQETDIECVLRFAVTDTGIGIAADAQGQLFKPFQQLDESTRRSYGGTGLGLVITKQIAELMGGEVGVDSSPGIGSTFWLTVHVTRVPAVRL